MIAAVGRDASRASLSAREAIAPVPGVIQGADCGHVAVVVVGVGGSADRGHRVGFAYPIQAYERDLTMRRA